MRKILPVALLLLPLSAPALGQSILDAPLLQSPGPIIEGTLPPAPETDVQVPENPYYDDRSTAASVIESLYNAINRAEYLRAWSYFAVAYVDGDVSAKQADFEQFAEGYAETQSVQVLVGAETSEGATGTIYYNIPVAIEATNTDGSISSFSGCYTLRLTQPSVQEIPPFTPLAIAEGELAPAEGSLEAILPGTCAPLA